MGEGFPDRMAADKVTIISALFEKRRYGKKNRKGFYIHSTDKKGKSKKERDPDMEGLLMDLGMKKDQDISDVTIIERMMLPMLMESSRCLEDGIVNSPVEVDMALIYGLGFPPFRGGIFRWADECGLAELVRSSENHARLGMLYQPTEQMQGMVSRQEVFLSA